MGSKPYGYILNLAIPTSSDNWLKKFSNGLNKDSKNLNLSSLVEIYLIHLKFFWV